MLVEQLLQFAYLVTGRPLLKMLFVVLVHRSLQCSHGLGADDSVDRQSMVGLEVPHCSVGLVTE